MRTWHIPQEIVESNVFYQEKDDYPITVDFNIDVLRMETISEITIKLDANFVSDFYLSVKNVNFLQW